MKAKTVYCLYILLFVMVIYVSSAKNILYMSPTASPSHNIWDKTLAMALRNKGHRITFATNSPEKSSENFTTIIFEDIYEKVGEEFDLQEMNTLDFFQLQTNIADWMCVSCSLVAESNGFKTLVKQAENGIKYDLIIFDISTAYCLLPIIGKFDYPPTVAVSAFGVPPMYTELFGMNHQAAYIPIYGLSFPEKMSFLQRFYNYIATLYTIYIANFVIFPKQMETAKTVFGDSTKHIKYYTKHFSIFLANYDPVFSYPQPLPPAIIPVGGLHVNRVNYDLPKDLKIYMDNSKNGVIIFSLGTNVRSDKLGETNQKILLDAFAELKQNVIWKFESNLNNIPKNVLIRKFLPQNDLLAHPNSKILINHGGALSTQEGLYHGLPIISMPFIEDQESNTFHLVTKGLGLKMDFFKLNKEYVLAQINEVLYNETYRLNSQKTSRRYRDRPDNALDRAVFWVEHVMRENGTDYLRIFARDMPFYQTELLDIWVLIGVIIIILYLVINKIYRKCMNKFVKKLKKH